jgi:hypothetical protein
MPTPWPAKKNKAVSPRSMVLRYSEKRRRRSSCDTPSVNRVTRNPRLCSVSPIASASATARSSCMSSGKFG